MIPLGIIVSLLILILITRPFTVLFHELGHAIPAALLTKERVTVYLGSYGKTKRSFKVKIGLLDIWLKPSLFWRIGMCVPTAKDIGLTTKIIYVLGGAVFTFLIAIASTYLIFLFDLHGALKLVSVFFLLSAIYDLYVNLIPKEKEIILDDGSIAYNDGYHLKLLFSYKSFLYDYEKAVANYNNKEYKVCGPLFAKLTMHKLAFEDLYRLAISSFLLSHSYKEAYNLCQIFESKYVMLSDDYVNSGLSRSYVEMWDEALLDYDKALELDGENKHALNNKGYQLNLISRYAEAIEWSSKAIEIDPLYAYSYNNMGFAKVMLGNVEEGLNDIYHSIDLDPNNSYTYLNLGIYYLSIDDRNEALNMFTKAKSMDSNTYKIDDYLNKINI